MPHVFISYSAADSAIARQIHLFLSCAGAEPFLAEINLAPGVKWKNEILDNLRQSQWVFFLATPNSCKSQPVAHELGAGMVLNKKIIPLMWKVTPKDLPPWVDDTQAIDLKDSSRIAGLIKNIGETIKSDKFWTGVFVACLVCLGVWLVTQE